MIPALTRRRGRVVFRSGGRRGSKCSNTSVRATIFFLKPSSRFLKITRIQRSASFRRRVSNKEPEIMRDRCVLLAAAMLLVSAAAYVFAQWGPCGTGSVFAVGDGRE